MASIALTVFVLDQWTKQLAVQHLPFEGFSTPFWSWFSFTRVHNRGVAFGMFNNLPETFRLWFLVALPLLVLGILWWTYVRQFREKDILGPVCMGLVFGGALGNLLDRVRLGYVVDFVDWFYHSQSGQCFSIFSFQVFSSSTRGAAPGTCHWPAFNIADSAISVAFVLLIIFSWQLEKRARAEKVAA